mgnify:FL=1
MTISINNDPKALQKYGGPEQAKGERFGTWQIQVNDNAKRLTRNCNNGPIYTDIHAPSNRCALDVLINYLNINPDTMHSNYQFNVWKVKDDGTLLPGAPF